MKESLISEPIEVVTEDAAADVPFQVGEPILPRRFRWRGAEYRVESVLETWKQYSGGSQSMPEHYLRKHWFHVVASSPEGTRQEMKIYFERQARSKGSARWWIYTIASAEA